jgi:hypothetical protein
LKERERAARKPGWLVMSSHSVTVTDDLVLIVARYLLRDRKPALQRRR